MSSASPAAGSRAASTHRGPDRRCSAGSREGENGTRSATPPHAAVQQVDTVRTEPFEDATGDGWDISVHAMRSASSIASRSRWCRLGMTRTCPRVAGPMSMNARCSIVLVDPRRRNVACDDLAEDAVRIAHGERPTVQRHRVSPAAISTMRSTHHASSAALPVFDQPSCRNPPTRARPSCRSHQPDVSMPSASSAWR